MTLPRLSCRFVHAFLGLVAAVPMVSPAAIAEAQGPRPSRLERYCEKNPERCDRLRARAGELKARCAADPVACEQRKAEARERLDAVRARCEADPVACAEKKARLNERLGEGPQPP